MCGREGIFPWSSDGRRRIFINSILIIFLINILINIIIIIG